MKTVLFLTMLLIGQLSLATTLDPNTFGKLSQLLHFEVDPNMYSQEIASATIQIDKIKQKATLTLQFKAICPKPNPSMPSCLTIAPDEIVIEAKNLQSRIGACGATVYTAELDERTYDGPLHSLTITDYTTIACKIAIPVERMTEVEYALTTSGFAAPPATYFSYFYGSQLMMDLTTLPVK